MKKLILIFVIFCTSCASTRPPIPSGTVPLPQASSQEDTLYGRAALKQLTANFPISNNRDDNRKVQNIVARLTRGARADHDPWYIYVLDSDEVVNAGATRGNHVFVWSGLLRTLPSDQEVASVLAHEIGHVLASHTRASPAEQLGSTVATIAGQTTRSIMHSTQGVSGPYGALAQTVVTEAMKGLLVNPESQRQELEADQIGLFILAQSGYDPRNALDFWASVSDDPRFGGGSIEFFSTHPASKTRLKALEKHLPLALERYASFSGNKGNAVRRNSTFQRQKVERNSLENSILRSPAEAVPPARGRDSFALDAPRDKRQNELELEKIKIPSRKYGIKKPQSLPLDPELSEWRITRNRSPLFRFPSQSETPVDIFRLRERVVVLCRLENWLRVISPTKGFIYFKDARPVKDERQEIKIMPCRSPR
jgi:metalloendopeptidase OMA1, mitochondrial